MIIRWDVKNQNIKLNMRAFIDLLQYSKEKRYQGQL